MFLNTIRKGWGVKPRGTIASSLWGTSGWFPYVWTLLRSLNVYVSVITLFVRTQKCLPIFLPRYVWWVILGINQSFHLSSLVYWRDRSIIFSASSFISDPGQVDVSVRIYAHFLSCCFFTLYRSVPRYSTQAHFDTSERFGAGKADALFGPNGHYRWKRRGKDTFDENTHGYEWGFADYTDETRCQSLPNPCRGTAKISAFPGLHTFARRYVTLIERPPASFHAPLQLPLGYSKTQNFS